MIFKREGISNCSSCPLRDQNRVWGQGSPGGIAILGEAPGADEDFEGEPFVGRAGKFLNWGMGSAGIPRQTTWCTNVISCRPPGNKIDSHEALEAITCCKPGLDAELKYLVSHGVKVIVPVGGTALEALKVEGSITKVRGSVYVGPEGLTVVPTFHPSYVMRTQFEKDSTKVTFKYIWIADFKKALNLAVNGWTPPKENFILKPAAIDVEGWINVACSRKALIGVDIETWQGKVFCIGLADGPSDALSVPIYKQGGYAYWHNGDWQRVKLSLDKLFRSCPLMFQNALFDVPYLKGEGFEIDFDRVQEDTLVLHHAISPELPHNLGFIVSTYGQTPYWKEDFLGRVGSISEMPDETLRTYNLRDSVVLHQVLPGMLADLREVGSERVYRNESLKLLECINEMVQTGFLLDQKKLSSISSKWEQDAKALHEELCKGFPKGFNIDSGDDLRWYLFGIEPGKFSKIKNLDTYEVPGCKKRKNTKVYQELLELKALRDELPKPYRLPNWKARSTTSGAVAVDKQGLLSYQIQLQNRLRDAKEFKHEKFKAEVLAIQQLLEWLRVYRDYSTISKLSSTFANYPISPDGRVHTQFLVHGTTTGRLSSRKPNLQNLPKKHEEARAPFVSRPGWKLLSADYSNLEVRVLAYETRDLVLEKALEEGLNVHDENTRVLFGLSPQDPEWGLARRAAKIFMFGGISYGGSDKEIHSKIAMEVPELGLTLRDYSRARSKWLEAHAAYHAWAEKTKQTARDKRLCTTFAGRCRTLHGLEKDIEKEALNTPIQGGAAHIVNQAMIRIHEKKLKLKSKLLVQVHDQLIYEVPEEELSTMLALVREEMERPVEIYGVKRVFPVDIAVGTSWAELYDPEEEALKDGDTSEA